MTFKDLKKDYIVYILHKDADEIKANQGKVINVSDSHLQQPMDALQMNQMQQLVVDVTIEEDGITRTYCIPETLSVTYAGNIVLSTDKDGILREVQAQLSRSDEHIKAMEFHEKRKRQCAEIIENWDPVFREKRETEQRFSDMEKRMKMVEESQKKVEEGQNRMNENFEKFLKKFE